MEKEKPFRTKKIDNIGKSFPVNGLKGVKVKFFTDENNSFLLFFIKTGGKNGIYQ